MPVDVYIASVGVGAPRLSLTDEEIVALEYLSALIQHRFDRTLDAYSDLVFLPEELPGLRACIGDAREALPTPRTATLLDRLGAVVDEAQTAGVEVGFYGD